MLRALIPGVLLCSLVAACGGEPPPDSCGDIVAATVLQMRVTSGAADDYVAKPGFSGGGQYYCITSMSGMCQLWQIELPQPGTYTIEVYAQGYESRTLQVTVPAGGRCGYDSVEQDVSLTPQQ